MANLAEIERRVLEAWRPPSKLSLSQWADEYARLSAESAAEPGRWRTLPYQRGIMDACTDPTVEMIVVMKSARVGYTKIVNNLVGYHIHQDPCPIMVVQPTIEDAEGYSKEEISPMIRDTPVLRRLVSEAKTRDSNNTILSKVFPGGNVSMVGANSPRGFRRVSRRIVIFDEVSGYPPSAGAEGDQIKLGIRRSEYYWNRKIVAGSTPTTEGVCRIEPMFEETDQQRYFVPCPHCGEMQFLKWSNIKWPEGRPLDAYYACEANGCVIDHSQKHWMVERGEWRATATAVRPGLVGFHIWAAYSYSPNSTWGHLAAEFLEAKDNAESLKTFVNTVLGETWKEEYSAKLNAEGLEDRVELYRPGTAPAGVLVVTAGVDVQDNRLEITRYGWGRDEEAWAIDHETIFGDPSKPEIWKQLDEVLFAKIDHEIADPLPLSVMTIDSGGHFTNEVYEYCRPRRKYGVIPIKGQSQRNKPIIGKPTKVDVNSKGVILKNSLELFPVGSDTAKSTIYARLKSNESSGAVYHFHGSMGTDFFKQLTSERQMVRYVKGFPIMEWTKKPGTRNEALDCAVYALAALHYLYTRYSRKTIWDQFERKLNIIRDKVAQSGDKQDINSESETNPADKLIKRRARNTMKRTNFVTGFK